MASQETKLIGAGLAVSAISGAGAGVGAIFAINLFFSYVAINWSEVITR